MQNQANTARARLADALKKMTQRDLAERSGITRSAISALVTGKRAPTAEHANALAPVLGRTPGYWLGEDEPAPMPVAPAKRVAPGNVHPLTGLLI